MENSGHTEIKIDYELEIMIHAAVKAGSFLKKMFVKDVNVQKKGAIDLVTDADFGSEKIIMEELCKKLPYPVIGEETSSSTKSEGRYFLVDPLDGTTNFSKKIIFYAVSIALMEEKKAVKGVVYLPELDEIYVASQGKGAYLILRRKDWKKLSVSKVNLVCDAVLATGFPYDVWENYEPVLKSLKSMLTKARALRRFGSAAIDLCYVARGIFDGYFEYSLKPWDTAAGYLIVEEAGGRVTNLFGKDFSPFDTEILATNGLIHEELRLLLLQE